jgi:hypothetical protein
MSSRVTFGSSATATRSTSDDEHLYCTIGGSGSTYLRHALSRQGLEVHNKPDTVFRRIWVRAGPEAQRAEFAQRAAGYRYGNFVDLSEVARYLDAVGRAPRVTTVLNTWAEQHVLRLCGMRPVTFLMREPAAAYRSYCEPRRHGDVADLYGGPNSLFALQFATRWCHTVEEYLHLRKQGWPVRLWAYEHAPPDPAIAGWEPSPARLSSLLDDDAIRLVRSVTEGCRLESGVPEWV